MTTVSAPIIVSLGLLFEHQALFVNLKTDEFLWFSLESTSSLISLGTTVNSIPASSNNLALLLDLLAELSYRPPFPFTSYYNTIIFYSISNFHIMI